MSAPTNEAAYLVATATALQVKPAPYPLPTDDQVVVKVHALAINPIDHFIQKLGTDVFNFVHLPAILGYDVAGEVVAVGSGVTKFRLGDRVAGLAEAAFQNYVPLAQHLTTAVPECITCEQAATLPMGISVSTKALFDNDLLGMSVPSLGSNPPPGKGKTVLIWGGSTSVGSCAIQLASAAGYEVITTASPHNFDYVKSLGARHAFDYNSHIVRQDLLVAFKGKTVAGALANAGFDRQTYPSIVEICAKVVQESPGKKVVAMTMAPFWNPRHDGVQCKFVGPLRGSQQLASSIFHDFLPGALSTGSLKPKPEPEVVGQGLEAVQGAMDVLRAGVSARKIVVTL
jgi:D-arabinose 1-dehydrogenase-like Zn-dependent alcohol dehydrogenase